jgi:hypothetical protein
MDHNHFGVAMGAGFHRGPFPGGGVHGFVGMQAPHRPVGLQPSVGMHGPVGRQPPGGVHGSAGMRGSGRMRWH